MASKSIEPGALGRRSFLKGSAAAAGMLCLGVSVGCGGARKARLRHAEQTKEFKANVFLTILPSGIARIHMHKAEFGQGVSMGFATLIAEELEIGLEDTEIVLADSSPEFRVSGFGVPMFATHATGGSTSTSEIYIPVRQAAAAARMMLVEAAASQWGVAATLCRAENGTVINKTTRQSIPYGDLTVAAARMEAPKSPKLKDRSEFRLIGKPGTRVDARSKATGEAMFGIDYSVPNMVRAAMIHPPAFGAKPKSVDASAAKQLPGTIDVITLPNGVAVVAEKYWQAKKAATKVQVEWSAGPAANLNDQELISTLLAYTKGGEVAEKHGNTAKGLRAGDRSLRASYDFPYLAHATLEPQNSIVSYQDDKVEVWSPCQSPSVIQDEVAAVTGVSSSDVLVHTTLSGGAFGRRTYPEAAVEAARISKKLKRPVQVVWSRENDMTAGRYRPAGASHIEGSVKSGKLHSLRIHNLVQVIIPDNVMFVRGGLPGALPNYAKNINVATIGAATRTNTQIDIPALEGIAETPYQIPNFRAEFTPVFTDIPVAFWRAVGHSHNGFIMESAIDELAALADVDPYQFRRLLLKNGTREMRVLDAVAKLSSWSSPAQDGFAKGIARHTSFGSEVAQVAEAGIVGGRIKVRKVWAVVDCGIAINPDVVKAQIESSIIFGLGAALDQQINIRNGVPQQKNYDTFPMTRMFESPEIEVEILDSDAHPSGIGEPGLPPLAPAVANAIYRAHGIRLRSMPMQQALARTKESK